MISSDIINVGVQDHQVDLFEGQFVVPNGMAYNSYVILDDKIVVIDTVDKNFKDEWLSNVEKTLDGKLPTYLLVQHMEPDHSGSIVAFMDKYKDAKIVSSRQAFVMMKNFYSTEYEDRRVVVTDGDTLNLGSHVLSFISAPMVHWPEVIFSYDVKDKVLFSADGFGKFGANDIEDPEGWACEARRYYFGIVGKYGVQVQSILSKAAQLNIETICPLHGPVLDSDISYYVNLYDIWSKWGTETDGVAIFYTSVYGNTKAAAELLKEKLLEKGCPKVVLSDLAREDLHECIEDAFRYGKIVLATTTYNSGLFPKMRSFVDELTERFYQNKTIGFIENGTWAPQAAKIIKNMFANSKNIRFVEPVVRILSSMNDNNVQQVDALAQELLK